VENCPKAQKGTNSTQVAENFKNVNFLQLIKLIFKIRGAKSTLILWVELAYSGSKPFILLPYKIYTLSMRDWTELRGSENR
jgi:hypothetical protein